MARRRSSPDTDVRRRRPLTAILLLAMIAAAVWLAPAVAVRTSLRDRPLAAACAGLPGSITSSSGRWRWLGAIEYRDVVIRDASGRAVVAVPLVVIDRGLLRLAFDPRDLGTVRLIGPEAVVEVRRGGTSLEDLVTPWLAAAPAAERVSFEWELVDGVVEFVDLQQREAWRVVDLAAAGTIRPDATLAGWTVSGAVVHTPREEAERQAKLLPPDTPARLDRTTIAARATAVLTRPGGWSVASPEATAAGRVVTIAAHELPLGVSTLLATRCDLPLLLDGLGDVACTLSTAADTTRLSGTVTTTRLSACRSDSLAEVATLGRLDVPLDLEIDGTRLLVRRLEAVAGFGRLEASGRIRLPGADGWDWIDGLAAEDFAVAADVDLAAWAQALPGGLAVRPDVQVTGGRLECSAAARPDGDDRILELRLVSRDLEAVQSVTATETAAAETRPLRWNEPFAAWIRARRRPDALVVVEEGRVVSAAGEVAVSGDADALAMQWTFDLDRLMTEAGELLDLGGMSLTGVSRGRLDWSRTPTPGGRALTATANLSDFACVVPGRPAWREQELAIEAEASCQEAGGGIVVDHGRAVLVSADDRAEVSLSGPLPVDVASLVAPRPAAADAAVSIEAAVSGDLARWQARLAGLVPGVVPPGVELAGRVDVGASLATRGDAWQVSRAGGEIESLTLRVGTTTISEPRVVASATGLVHPRSGQVDLSAAEILTATCSARTAGLAWIPSGTRLIDRLRGSVQWQADVARLQPWLAAADVTTAWQAGGRIWGTVELVDAPAGSNMLLRGTGSQLTLSRTGGAGQPARVVWSEPRIELVAEVTQPAADGGQLLVDRLSLESSTVALAAGGNVSDHLQGRLLSLDGNLSCDWQQLSRLVTPWTGARLRLTGSTVRPFALKVPLDGADQAAATAAAVTLPPDWAGDAADALVLVPVGAADRRRGLPAAVSLDTSVAWDAADLDGIAVEAGEMPLRLVEGQLALGPLDIGIAAGRVRGAPWVSLVGPHREFVVPPGRIVDRVRVGGAVADRFLRWISPLLGDTTRADGFVSVDLGGARLPLEQPFAGEAVGQITFESFEVVPGPLLQPLAMVLSRLQAVVDPRLAFGDKPVLMRVRPEPIRVRLAEGRLWHEGLVLDSGQLAVRSAGSVAADGGLDMTLEVAFRGEIAGQTPVVAQLLRTPLVIPLTGSVSRPQFDARALDRVLARIVENTAGAVITDGVVRGLDALLGGQRPAPASPPVAPGAAPFSPVQPAP